MKNSRIKRTLSALVMSALLLNMLGCGNTKTTVESIESTLENVENMTEQELVKGVEKSPKDIYRKELEQAFVAYWNKFVYEPKDPMNNEEEFQYQELDYLALVDMNHDGIPEVNLHTSSYQMEWLYTYYNGEVKELASEYRGGYSYFDEGNIIIENGSGWLEWRIGGDHYSKSNYDEYMCFESGKLETIAYYVIDEYLDYSDYSNNYTEEAWFIGNPYSEDYEEVTEEEWNAYMADLIPLGEEREIYGNTVWMTPEAVMEAFQSYADEAGVEINMKELLSDQNAAKKFATNALKDTYCYGDYLVCKLDAQQTKAFIEAIEAMPESIIDHDCSGDLKCFFADIAGDGVPVLLMAYECKDKYCDMGNMIGDLNVWILEDGQAVMYDLEKDIDDLNCGLSIGIYEGENVLCLQDGWACAVGDCVGWVWYRIQNGEIEKIHYLKESSDYITGEYEYILDDEECGDWSQIPWQEQTELSDIATFAYLNVKGIPKEEMLLYLNEYLKNIS